MANLLSIVLWKYKLAQFLSLLRRMLPLIYSDEMNSQDGDLSEPELLVCDFKGSS